MMMIDDFSDGTVQLRAQEVMIDENDFQFLLFIQFIQMEIIDEDQLGRILSFQKPGDFGA